MNKIIFKIKKYHKIIIIILILFIDYLTKSFIFKNFQIYNKIKIFNILNIVYVKNYGFIFGWYAYKHIWNYILINTINIIFIIIMILFTYYYILNKNSKNYYSILFLTIGFIGNTIDRIKYGYIIDFFDLHYKYVHLPIFNISDICIIFGYIFFLKNYISFSKNYFIS
ncbi:signal peptidase II [Buchnera aphidicola]|uniref:signal peptidase II n=1 Tax=Buchnera aphidicola TaxID=9 RepID=UPI002238F8B6|nr:signal peptidase II [Buchnera aphidicola]MCW5197643.1 signal peptidase II [Buchnera aphidicola (Chaitophorus viminalis)]